jgi:hypothetical protein
VRNLYIRYLATLSVTSKIELSVHDRLDRARVSGDAAMGDRKAPRSSP